MTDKASDKTPITSCDGPDLCVSVERLIVVVVIVVSLTWCKRRQRESADHLRDAFVVQWSGSSGASLCRIKGGGA